jgi:hypothetical protein
MVEQVRTWWSRWEHGGAGEDMVEQVRTWWSRWGHGGAGGNMVEQVRIWRSRWEQSKPGNDSRMKTIITREQMWPVFMGDEYDERGESRAAEKVRTGWGRKSVERLRWISRGQCVEGDDSVALIHKSECQSKSSQNRPCIGCLSEQILKNQCSKHVRVGRNSWGAWGEDDGKGEERLKQLWTGWEGEDIKWSRQGQDKAGVEKMEPRMRMMEGKDRVENVGTV